jgi:CAAX prenyl protease-like protein
MQRQDKMSRSFVAYILPFALYVIMTMFESSVWTGLSYEFVCSLKGFLATAAAWSFRKYYPAFSMKGLWIAIAAGILGCFVWIVLERAQRWIPGNDLLKALLLQTDRAGYNPFASGWPSIPSISFLAIRLIELIVIVPIIEEMFWRGFVARFILAEDFPSVPQGKFTVVSFLIVTFGFATTHPELLSAITWCAMINWLYWKTKNLWACVFMHAVTNGLLGAYILTTGAWRLW